MKLASTILTVLLAGLPTFVFFTRVIFKTNKLSIAAALKGRDNSLHEFLTVGLVLLSTCLQSFVPLAICGIFVPAPFPSPNPWIIISLVNTIGLIGGFILWYVRSLNTDDIIREIKNLPAEEKIKLLKNYGLANNHC